MQPNKRRYKVKRKIYSVDGVDQDWHYYTHGSVAYIIEGSHHNPRSAWTRQRSIEGLRPISGALMDRLMDGPTLSGHTVDPEGVPVSATVTIDEVQTFEGERWTSRAREGRFDRMLSGPGRVTVRANAAGYAEASATLRVQGWETVELVLRPL